MWKAFFCVGSTQFNFSLKKQQSTVSKNISAEDGGNWAAAGPRATAAVTAIVMAVAAAAGVVAAAVVVAKEMANAKQTVEAEAKTQQSTIKKQKKWQRR